MPCIFSISACPITLLSGGAAELSFKRIFIILAASFVSWPVFWVIVIAMIIIATMRTSVISSILNFDVFIALLGFVVFFIFLIISILFFELFLNVNFQLFLLYVHY